MIPLPCIRARPGALTENRFPLSNTHNPGPSHKFMKPTRRTILSLAALASLAMLAPSHAGTATAGTLATFDELADLDLSGDFLYALNTGQDVYYGNPVGDPYAGGTWGSGTQGNGQNLTVGDASFMADMWNINDEGRNWNKDDANPNSDAAVFGTNDDWRFFPERGANNTGNDDGGIAGLANYVSGYQSQNAKWQSPYEGKHDHDTSNLFSGDSSTDATNLRTILSRSGTQNLGGYSGGLGVGERDITYDFDVIPGERYKLQILFYKNSDIDEGTTMRIDVEDVNVADKIDMSVDTDGDTQGLVYTYEFTAGDDTLNIDIGKRTDNADGGTAGRTIADVNAITLEGPASDFQLIIKPNASTLGNYDFTWDSSSNKVYDLVSNTNLDTSPLNWPVWDGRANIPSGGTTTTLENVPGGGDPTRFFAVVGKAPPPPPLVNGSFETPVGLNDGVSAALGSPWAPVPDPLPGMVWVETWNPPLSEYNLVDFPDGDNVCYVFFDVPAPGSAFGASQVLTETFAANTNYMVTVKVGRSNTYDWPGFRVVLLAGGTVLASDEDPSTTAPTAGNFINSTVSYTYDAGDVGLVGQSLEIRLLSRGVIVDGAGANGWEVDFDDVSFTATPAP
jgi:hypothetical protein